MEPANCLSFADLAEGMQVERSYTVTPLVYENFLRAFDDRSPIHVDADYAVLAGFDGPVMHGTILNGFVSHFVGMVFPGANSLLLSVNLRYASPTYLGDTLELRAKCAQKVDSQRVVVLHVTLFNQTRGRPAATGRVQVQMRST
jgi:acyl dehydratase